MQGNRLLVPFHVPGTLAANITLIFQAVKAMTLVAVQTVNTANSGATFILGTSADDDAYLTTQNLGDSSTPTVINQKASFVGEQFPHIDVGTTIVMTIDYDGAGGTAAANMMVVLEFLEG